MINRTKSNIKKGLAHQSNKQLNKNINKWSNMLVEDLNLSN